MQPKLRMDMASWMLDDIYNRGRLIILLAKLGLKAVVYA